VHTALQKNFPGAIPDTVVLQRSIEALRPLGLEPENTLLGMSICPDEINHEKGDLSDIMKEYWAVKGEVFPMGGIGGVPFVGKTGFGAFSAHVPDDGHLIVLFGPHLAISDSGELGKYLRDGQKGESTACGAVLAAYDACTCKERSAGILGKSFSEVLDEDDMQQSYLMQKIGQRLDVIEAAPVPLAELATQAYELVEEQMLKIVNTNFGPGKLVLLGGIQINMPYPYKDHFQPLYFKAVSQDDPAGVDLLDNFRKQS